MEIDRETPSPEGEEIQETKDKSKPIVVILMGLPGSGKSTFCDAVMRISSRQWARVCQDTINNGKGGTRIQCLSSASTALKEGKSVLIDRCNIDREQRVEFLKLGGQHVEKHMVVLDLPAKLCISRSVKRTEHEGNLQGGKAAAVVNRMVPKKELPKISEGFTRITFCQEEKDMKEAVNVYGSLGPLDSLPSGCFGKKNQDTKTQLGIMKFLKKVDKDTGLQGSKKGPAPLDDSRECLIQGVDKLDEKVPTLAFPSISTADFQFNLEKASDIIVEKVEEFVSRIGKARLVLVDLSHGSKILSLVKTKAAEKNIDSKKFFTFVGDITRLRSEKGLECNVIANAANWRLKPGCGGVNAAIFRAAGSSLETATKERAECLNPGKCLVVPIPSFSPLFTREGVTHVIHVLGPNMNPMRPDCLKDDYVKGCKVLREAYSSLFEGFMSLMSSTSDDYQKGRRESVDESDKNKKHKGMEQDFEPSVSSYGEGRNTIEDKKAWGPWAQALYNVAMNPEKHKDVVLEASDDVVVMNDAYPKAKRHLLVLARVDGLNTLGEVHKEHMPLLNKMHDFGMKWAEKFLNDDQSLLFRLGYHSVPSMRQLHLHVVSQDFDSPHLKNKKHWNSFNSPFFLDSLDVISEVNELGKVNLKDDKFLSMELRCHRCRSAHPNIPRLKAHITSCRAPFPDTLIRASCFTQQ